MGSTEAGSVSPAFDAFRRGWETEFGADFPLPAFSPATTGDFRVRSREPQERCRPSCTA